MRVIRKGERGWGGRQLRLRVRACVCARVRLCVRARARLCVVSPLTDSADVVVVAQNCVITRLSIRGIILLSHAIVTVSCVRAGAHERPRTILFGTRPVFIKPPV